MIKHNLLNAFAGALLVVTLMLPMVSQADDDEHERGDRWSSWKTTQDSKSNPLYAEECGGCHLAYPVRFLSSDVWNKIMSNLDKHFGDNAEVDADVNKQITHYLVSNADSGRWSRNSNAQTLRISDSRFFIRKHHEVPKGAVGPNSKVKSYANCQACHPNADNGSFQEREIKIPGFRFWDD